MLNRAKLNRARLNRTIPNFVTDDDIYEVFVDNSTNNVLLSVKDNNNTMTLDMSPNVAMRLANDLIKAYSIATHK
jgi:hypothetical protein